ncbi:hypothetical protein NHX12_034438 [Muraenolepis orangiensis]|uniref:Cilia- and flagella-associated protein 157 n=1 Tax=Muraenolepis orangiensis TaxID=630683 RepID=A0A9Q0D8I9_9TELE|nr:hypothetical protein NHX12_034438 [Muraenolepis orangiensis]
MSKKNQRKDGEKLQKKSTVSETEKSRGKDTEFYLLQTRTLEEQLGRCQRRCDELQVLQADFSSRSSQLEQEKRDMVQYLKRSVAQLEEELGHVSERLASEQSCTRTTRRRVTRSTPRTWRWDQLANQKETHNEVIYQLEKNAVLEKDRLKREHADHMAAVAVEMQHQARSSVSEAVSRCLGEREALQGELAHLAEQNQVLVLENQTLRDSETLLRRKGKERERLLEAGRKDAATVQLLGAELEEERRGRGQMETILQEAGLALRQALVEERKEEEQEVEEEEGKEEVQYEVHRNQMMQKLLAILDGAARLQADRDVMTRPLLEEAPPPGDPGLVRRQNQTSRGTEAGSPSRAPSQHLRKSSQRRSGP